MTTHRPYVASRIEEPPGKNRFGGTETLAAVQGTIRDKQQLVWWQGHRDEVRSLGINYSLELLPQLFGGPVRLQATLILDWGGDGASFQAELDFVRGGNVVVQGSYIRATARNDSTDAVGSLLPVIPVSAGLSFAGATSKMTTIHPTRTFFEGDLAANSPLVIRIPPFAKTVDFIRNNFLASSFSAQFRDTTAIGFLGGIVVPAGAQMVRELQIPQGAATLELTDTGGTSRILTIFGLDL